MMFVNGCDCSIIIKTTHIEKDIPYSDETLREAVSILQEEASIERDGVCRGLRKSCGVTGCVVTPLTIGTAPLLLYLAMGSAGNPLFVSETRNLYKYSLDLMPTEDTEHFDLIQDRTGNSEQITGNRERLLYEGCRVKGFELRVMRGETLKLKLDICGDRNPVTYPYTDTAQSQTSEMSGTVIGKELFQGDCVTYQINGKEYTNIYGITLVSKKQGGTRTEIWIKRILQEGADIPHAIEELIVTAQLQRDTYELRHYGAFRITLKRLVFISDETDINTADTVIGPIRYYVAGSVSTEVFTSGEEVIP